MHSWIVRHVLLGMRIGLRSPAMRWGVLCGLVGIVAALLGASFSLRQTRVVAIDLGFSALRFYLSMMAIAAVHELVSQDFHRKSLVLPLIWPSSRAHYVIGRFCAVVLLLLLAQLIFMGVSTLALPFADWGYAQSTAVYMDWRLALALIGPFFESMVIAAFLTMMACVIGNPALLIFVGLAFVWAARVYGPVIEYLRYAQDADPMLQADYLRFLQMLRWVIPDLSGFDWREAVLYGKVMPASEYFGVILLTIGFSTIYIGLAIYCMDKREVQ